MRYWIVNSMTFWATVKIKVIIMSFQLDLRTLGRWWSLISYAFFILTRKVLTDRWWNDCLLVNVSVYEFPLLFLKVTLHFICFKLTYRKHSIISSNKASFALPWYIFVYHRVTVVLKSDKNLVIRIIETRIREICIHIPASYSSVNLVSLFTFL